MADEPSSEPKEQTTETPAPEVLKPRDESGGSAEHSEQANTPGRIIPKRRHQTYHPSHKATFIGLAVVVAILAINAGVITFVLKSQSKTSKKSDQGQVTISAAALDKLGVNNSSVGDLGVQLVVNPNAKFNGSVTVGGDTSIGGQLKLNSKFTATDASLAQLEAGNTSLQTLNVNGDTTTSNLNLRQDLLVTGTSHLQGPTIMSQLLTVNNNVNVSGSLSIGGTLSVNNLHTSSLVIDSNLTVGGHVITGGSAPTAFRGGSVGQNGTVSISGNDTAGTVVVNVGTGGGSGTLVSVTFRHGYTNTPHVVVTPIGASPGNFYVNRSTSGFSIAVSGSVGVGSYAFDYIIEQ
jgi:hypothetical protein